MPIFVDVITRLEERSAKESAKRIETTFADAGKSAGTEFSRNVTAEMDRASKAVDQVGRQMLQGFGAHGLAAGREFGGAFGSQLTRSIPGVSGFTSAMAGYEGGREGWCAGGAGAGFGVHCRCWWFDRCRRVHAVQGFRAVQVD